MWGEGCFPRRGGEGFSGLHFAKVPAGGGHRGDHQSTSQAPYQEKQEFLPTVFF